MLVDTWWNKEVLWKHGMRVLSIINQIYEKTIMFDKGVVDFFRK